MSSTTSNISESTKRILESNHMTAQVDTEKGRYTVVARPGFVVVIRDRDGVVKKGQKLQIHGDHLWLFDGTHWGQNSSRLLSAYILSN